MRADINPLQITCAISLAVEATASRA